MNIAMVYELLLSVVNSLGEFKHGMQAQRLASTFEDPPAEAAHCFLFSEIEDATKMLEKKIGSGGFGDVYYGKMKDGREIAVKVLTNDSCQGKREFSNEVNLIMNLESEAGGSFIQVH